MANPKTPITELDFDSIKSQLKTYLKTQTQFKDYNFEGSNLSAMLDVLAFNSFQNNFYTNMAINEMFLDSAVLKNSIVSHAKELNYLPRSRKSAKATVTVQVTDPTLTDATVTIPQYTQFTASYQGETYTFVTDQVYVAKRVGVGQYTAENVDIFEGQMLTSFQREGFIIDADGVLRVQLTNNEVDTDSIVVFVDAEATEDQNVFTKASTIFGVGPLDLVFYLEPYLDDRYAIYFGANKFGLQPEEQEDIRVKYRICSGEEANDASSFNTAFLEGATINVITTSPASGGADRESMESIRYFAPKALQIQERAVTTSDYEVLLQQRFPEITAVSAYGGEELDPPQYGKVAISVYLADDTTLISSTLAAGYINYLSSKSPLGIEPFFVQTKFIYADIIVNSTYSTKRTEKSEAELEGLIRTAIQNYSDTNLENFDTTLRVSKLGSAIDALDGGIESNSIEIQPIIEYAPVANFETNPIFKFSSELIKPYPFKSVSGFTDFKPSIRSSVYDDINGTCVYFADDGNGVMMTITDDISNPQIINPAAGTVNYKTGEVKLTKFVASAYTGAGIKVFARLKNSDVVAPKGRVFIIRDTDVKVNMVSESTGLTEASSTSPASYDRSLSSGSSSSSSSY